MILEKAYFFHRNLHISHIHQKFIQLENESIEYKIVMPHPIKKTESRKPQLNH